MALFDWALFLQRYVPGLYLLKCLVSDVVLSNSNSSTAFVSKKKREQMRFKKKIFFFGLHTTLSSRDSCTVTLGDFWKEMLLEQLSQESGRGSPAQGQNSWLSSETETLGESTRKPDLSQKYRVNIHCPESERYEKWLDKLCRGISGFLSSN